MKALFFILLIAITQSATAQRVMQTTYKTLYTCEQPDGDTWYSVGLVETGATSNYNFILVKNDDDSSKLVVDKRAILVKRTKAVLVYEDESSTMRLTISKVRNGFAGRFSKLADGRGSIDDVKMDCFAESEITFNRNGGPQPRISVGN